MPVPTIHKAAAWEDTGPILMARLISAAGVYILQADLSAIAFRVTDMSDESNIASGAMTISSVIFDTLQTPAIWTEDSTGYNFRYDMLATQLPAGDRVHRMEIKFTPAAAQPFMLVYELDTKAIYIS